MDHLVALVHALDTCVFAGHDACAVELVGEHRVEDLVDERGFAGPRDTGHTCHHAQGEPHGQVLEVVLARPHHGELLGCACLAALLGHFDAAPAGNVVAGDGTRGVHKVIGGAGIDDFAAMFAGAGADVDEPVGAADRVFVDDERVAQVAQMVQGVDQARVVALVQADRGFVKHVHDAHEA